MANSTELFDIRLTDCGKWEHDFEFWCHITSNGALCCLRCYLKCKGGSLSALFDYLQRRLRLTFAATAAEGSDITLEDVSLAVLGPGHGSGSQL